MRTKEDSDDYRYFPCPDLLPVILDDEYIDTVRLQMPELPEARRARFIADYGLTEYDATQLTGERAMADYFEATVKACGEAKLAANWIMAYLSAYLNKAELTIAQSHIKPYRQLPKPRLPPYSWRG